MTQKQSEINIFWNGVIPLLKCIMTNHHAITVKCNCKIALRNSKMVIWNGEMSIWNGEMSIWNDKMSIWNGKMSIWKTKRNGVMAMCNIDTHLTPYPSPSMGDSPLLGLLHVITDRSKNWLSVFRQVKTTHYFQHFIMCCWQSLIWLIWF